MGSEMDVIKAAKELVDFHDERGQLLNGNIMGLSALWGEAYRKALRTLRTALAAHESAPTVAVPVAVLREWRNGNSIVVGDVVCAEVPMHDIDALLPPREPPRELVEEWEREAEAYADAQFGTEAQARRAAAYGYRAACRARWAAENGGA